MINFLQDSFFIVYKNKVFIIHVLIWPYFLYHGAMSVQSANFSNQTKSECSSNWLMQRKFGTSSGVTQSLEKFYYNEEVNSFYAFVLIPLVKRDCDIFMAFQSYVSQKVRFSRNSRQFFSLKFHTEDVNVSLGSIASRYSENWSPRREERTDQTRKDGENIAQRALTLERSADWSTYIVC